VRNYQDELLCLRVVVDERHIDDLAIIQLMQAAPECRLSAGWRSSGYSPTLTTRKTSTSRGTRPARKTRTRSVRVWPEGPV
jgi:hypothetical protein